jgi:hypothetical protein
MEAVKIRLLSVDNNRSAIMVNISVVIAALDHDGSVAIAMITVADDAPITVPVTCRAKDDEFRQPLPHCFTQKGLEARVCGTCHAIRAFASMHHWR